MGVDLHWFLPTNGDSRTDLSLGNAVGVAGSRVTAGGTERAPDIGYIGQIARSAEQLGFTGALTPTSSWCEDAWLMTAALTQVTERFKFLVAFRPGLMSPTLAAHMAATFQRVSRGRLLLNVVTGGDDVEQRRFGDHLGKDDRYQRAGEFLHIVRELWRGEPVTLEQVGRQPPDATAAARGSVAVAAAKAFASETAVSVASDLFTLTGASAADERYDLSRLWRNARTHASHDPVDWKYHHIGNYLLNSVLPPNHGQI